MHQRLSPLLHHRKESKSIMTINLVLNKTIIVNNHFCMIAVFVFLHCVDVKHGAWLVRRGEGGGGLKECAKLDMDSSFDFAKSYCI